jgi:hypothetical protein
VIRTRSRWAASTQLLSVAFASRSATTFIESPP